MTTGNIFFECRKFLTILKKASTKTRNIACRYTDDRSMSGTSWPLGPSRIRSTAKTSDGWFRFLASCTSPCYFLSFGIGSMGTFRGDYLGGFRAQAPNEYVKA